MRSRPGRGTTTVSSTTWKSSSTAPIWELADSDGFDDLFEMNTGFDPTLGTNTPEAYSEVLTDHGEKQ
ncbi:MAG: hypothetical protein ACKVLL_16660 [Verrucomicrobiales bacterium]